jgi:hypothetical protein
MKKLFNNTISRFRDNRLANANRHIKLLEKELVEAIRERDMWENEAIQEAKKNGNC